MKYLSEYRDPAYVKAMLTKIAEMASENITIMEVCGTHTMSIFKSGLRQLLPSNIKLISGPGCPVCVTSQGYIDTAIELSKDKNIIITTFGDMLRVPGNGSSLQEERALGRDIRIVYSPLDAVRISEENPNKEVVFLGIGFETTAPTIALSILKAYGDDIKNFSVLGSIKTMPNTMKALVLDKDIEINGFLCPGHVSTVIGAKPYEFLARDYGIPAVVAGFEPSDIVTAIYHILHMLQANKAEIINQYSRLVKEEGNKNALSVIYEVFEVADSTWRGLGTIPATGLSLKDKYKDYNAEYKLKLSMLEDRPIKGCLCGEILKGKKSPLDCKLFSTVCNPVTPIGACMVSEEGTCAAYYKYNISE
jgi:hydrogenase expression/formation protein HypD